MTDVSVETEHQAVRGSVKLREVIDELRESRGLFGEALVDRDIHELAVWGELLADAGDEYTVRIEVRAAVAEDLLQMFDRAQAAPDAGGLTDERDRLAVKALGELEHV